jgi:hypothetical protein
LMDAWGSRGQGATEQNHGEAVALGIPDIWLTPGDHICAFYRGLAERDEILIPYLREGLRAGHKCICVVDATEPDSVIASLSADDELSLRKCLAHQQIDVLTSRQTYLESGKFSVEAMLEFWDGRVSSALRAGEFTFARVVGEMTWTLKDLPGVDEFLQYESELNRWPDRYPQVVLCLYDLERFSGEIMMDILKTHPKVLVGGIIMENPYFLAPDEFLAARR